ncbi:hypothetical protein QBC35DRAFT_510749 [Podospora australis]|uniref:Uncharacterized protein n=1 Tax=Podospora australis TaxID=1536484 RepID=A0AAN6WHR3_9PEZI|nr:hypothetical protein QBC35DRAFT_510749 [Podospora australis]
MSRPSSSKSNDSAKSTDSYASVLSEDSYIATFKPVDDDFKNLLEHVKMVENGRKILKERKVQSHEVKKRDPKDTERRTDWTPQMEADYLSYKKSVEALTVAKKAQEASEKLAKNSKKLDITTQEVNRRKALDDDEKWLNAAIAAATARLGFMTKYPNALSTPSTKTHIKAAEDNLNSAKTAKREIEIQKKKIAEIKVIEAKKAAAAAGKK